MEQFRGPTPMVSYTRNPAPRQEKWWEPLVQQVVGGLIQGANNAGSQAMNFGLQHALNTQQAGNAGSLGYAKNYEAMKYGEGGEGDGKGLGVTSAGLRAIGRTMPERSADGAPPVPAPQPRQDTPVMGEPSRTPSLPPQFTDTPAKTASNKLAALVGSVPNFGANRSASVRASVSGRAPVQNPFATAMMGDEAKTIPVLNDAARTSAGAQKGVTGFGEDARGAFMSLARETAADTPFNVTTELNKYEDEYLSANPKASLTNLRDRVAAYKYAEGKLRADPRYSKEQERVEGARMAWQLAKDTAAVAANHALAGERSAAPGVDVTRANIADYRKALEFAMQQSRKGGGPGMTQKQYLDQMGVLQEMLNQAATEPARNAVRQQMAYLNSKARSAGIPTIDDEAAIGLETPTQKMGRQKELIGDIATEDAVDKSNRQYHAPPKPVADRTTPAAATSERNMLLRAYMDGTNATEEVRERINELGDILGLTKIPKARNERAREQIEDAVSGMPTFEE